MSWVRKGDTAQIEDLANWAQNHYMMNGGVSAFNWDEIRHEGQRLGMTDQQIEKAFEGLRTVAFAGKFDVTGPAPTVHGWIEFSDDDVLEFKRIWPASGLPDHGFRIKVTPTGDLVEIHGLSDEETSRTEGTGAVSVMVDDAKAGKLGHSVKPTVEEAGIEALTARRATMKLSDDEMRRQGWSPEYPAYKISNPHHGEHKSIWYITKRTGLNEEDWEEVSTHTSREDADQALAKLQSLHKRAAYEAPEYPVEGPEHRTGFQVQTIRMEGEDPKWDYKVVVTDPSGKEHVDYMSGGASAAEAVADNMITKLRGQVREGAFPEPPRRGDPARLGKWIEVSEDEVRNFKRAWPASGLPDTSVRFKFDQQGNLVDLLPLDWAESAEGTGAASALASDARDGKTGQVVGPTPEEVAMGQGYSVTSAAHGVAQALPKDGKAEVKISVKANDKEAVFAYLQALEEHGINEYAEGYTPAFDRANEAFQEGEYADAVAILKGIADRAHIVLGPVEASASVKADTGLDPRGITWAVFRNRPGSRTPEGKEYTSGPLTPDYAEHVMVVKIYPSMKEAQQAADKMNTENIGVKATMTQGRMDVAFWDGHRHVENGGQAISREEIVRQHPKYEEEELASFENGVDDALQLQEPGSMKLRAGVFDTPRGRKHGKCQYCGGAMYLCWPGTGQPGQGNIVQCDKCWGSAIEDPETGKKTDWKPGQRTPEQGGTFQRQGAHMDFSEYGPWEHVMSFATPEAAQREVADRAPKFPNYEYRVQLVPEITSRPAGPHLKVHRVEQRRKPEPELQRQAQEETFSPEDAGMVVPADVGAFVGARIQEFARKFGWSDAQVLDPEDEAYFTATQGAVEYLQDMAPTGYRFGISETGDFGLWSQEDVEDLELHPSLIGAKKINAQETPPYPAPGGMRWVKLEGQWTLMNDSEAQKVTATERAMKPFLVAAMQHLTVASEFRDVSHPDRSAFPSEGDRVYVRPLRVVGNVVGFQDGVFQVKATVRRGKSSREVTGPYWPIELETVEVPAHG